VKQERSLAEKFTLRLERGVKRRGQKTKKNVGGLTKKPLGVRYAEVLKLRQTILQTQSAAKRRKVGNPASE
jgi:hypothetical protein